MSLKALRGPGPARFILALALALLSEPAFCACGVNASGVAFGMIDPLVTADHASTGSITVTCDTVTGYSISLGPGSGSFSQREMSGSGGVLRYNLYDDASHSRVWGDGSGATVTVNGSADAGGNTHTIYGLSPHQPTAVPGSYSDTITVTVSY